MNAFETLGLRWDADQAQVHAAYRSRVKGCHPDQFQDQAVLLVQKTVEKMFLFDLLVSVFVCDFFQVIDGLDGFLCKFINIHKSCLLLV